MWTFYCTRMHSSRRRTVRCSGRLPGELSARGMSTQGASARGSLADTPLWTKSETGVKTLPYYVADGKHGGTLKLDAIANFYRRIASKPAQWWAIETLYRTKTSVMRKTSTNYVCSVTQTVTFSVKLRGINRKWEFPLWRIFLLCIATHCRIKSVWWVRYLTICASLQMEHTCAVATNFSVADPGWPRGPCPPPHRPCKNKS